MRIQSQVFEQIQNGSFPMTELMRKYAVPGAALAVIQDGEITFSGAYGVRNEQGTPMTEGVLFECASLTKSVFALLAMQEVQAGKIDLDAPIAPLLKEEPWSDDPRFMTITPRQCLSHGCGLPNWQAKPMDMLFDPGTKYSYSGEGYFLLQKLIEQIEGKNMNELFQERVFGKYGMESSTAYWTPAVYAAFSVGFAKDGSIRKVRNERRVSGNAPEPNAAWSLYSYAADYARFVQGLMNDRGGLDERTFGEMARPQNQADGNIDWGLGFGMPRADRNVLWHWGDNSGFKSFSVWDKETRAAVVINTNSDNGMDLYIDLLKQLTDGSYFDDIAAFINGAE